MSPYSRTSSGPEAPMVTLIVGLILGILHGILNLVFGILRIVI